MKDDARRDMLRRLPAVDRILNRPAVRELGADVPHQLVRQAAREVLDELRADISAGHTPDSQGLSPEQIALRVHDRVLLLNRASIRGVINATGIILHTGLGRAILSDAAYRAVCSVASGHSNLEIDAETGNRGSRKEHYARLLADLCGAEAGMAVNNNAGAVFLAVNTLARGKEVIISRGQLVEIGGSFRLPDIMSRAGVRLVEVGTTNRTRISDYEAAITEETGLILRVHPSNFRMVGYTQEATLEEMAELGNRYGIPVMDDVGSGALVDTSAFGLEGDPLVTDSIRAGADVVTFSGDKLVGGPQAGLIVGRNDILHDIASNPLARVLRVDKLTVAALEATLRLYMDTETVNSAIPTLRYISRSVRDIERAAKRLRRLMQQSLPDTVSVELVDGFSQVGGGSLPGQTLPTKLVALSATNKRYANPMELARALRTADTPVYGRVGDGRLLLDLRTVEEDELPAIVRVCVKILSS